LEVARVSIILPRPDWFTKECYLEMKAQGTTDRYIYEDILFVSLKTFARFKRELGVLGVGNQGGHNRKVDYLKAKELHRKGYPIRMIADRYGASYKKVYNIIHYEGGM
jgi:hypothetical protein